MLELRKIDLDDIPDPPTFGQKPEKLKKEEARRALMEAERAKEEAEKRVHHAALSPPQAEVRLFSMGINMEFYYPIHVIIPAIRLKEFSRAFNQAYLGTVKDVEMFVVEFRDKKLAFNLEDGREI